MVAIYFRGGEDIDWNLGALGGLDGTGGHFRSGYSRYALNPYGGGNWIQNYLPWNGGAGASSFWFSAYNFINSNANAQDTLGILDTAKVTRYRLNGGANTLTVYKQTAAGAATSLGTFTWANGALQKIDIQIVDAVAGTFNIWINSVSVFTYSGDTTTDSAVHNYAYANLGKSGTGGGAGGNNAWSEIIVSDTDTRAMSLVTLIPAANGNTHNFDTGSPAAANINEATLNQATIDGSSVAGQIDQYTTNALPSGSFSILDIGITAQMMRGYTGPAHMDMGVRSGSTPADYWSADQALNLAWTNYAADWLTDPSTSAAWTALPVNIGLRSVT